MMDSVDLPLILIAALIACISPGPATLAIAGTAMKSGRKHGLALASGITTGSLFWSIIAAAGMGALMLANAWVLELVRYLGAGYLLYLAYRSARSAINKTEPFIKVSPSTNLGSAYLRGLAIHITNPKAILFFGSLYAVAVPADAPISSLVAIIVILGIQTSMVFHLYALMFSNSRLMNLYMRLRRWFEATFALAFGAAGLRILTVKLD